MQTIRLFISEWDGRCDWLQTTAEHDVIWSIWAGDCGELSCYTWTENGSFTRNLTSWSVHFWFVLLTEHDVLHCYAPNAVYRCVVAGQLYPSCGFSLADCWCFQVSNLSWEIHSTAFIHHAALTDRDFQSELHLSVKVSWFCLIFTNI